MQQSVSSPDLPPFESLFMANHAYVCRSLSYMGVSSANIDDLAQEVFLVLHRRLADFDPSRDLRSWLFGVARRVAQTHRRGAARAERKLAVVPPAVPAPAPDDVLSRSEEVAMVDRFVAGLPDKLRDVFVLSEIEGHAAPEIAAALGIKVNTVYSRVRLGRERFARALARHRAAEDRHRG
ncbi:MAG: RNA polymerase sigma factor [Myxococcota bacterium]